MEVLDPRHHRRDRIEWEAWCWAELVAGRYTASGGDTPEAYRAEDDSITLERTWSPPRYGSTTEEGAAQRHRPVVVVSEARVAQYEQQLSLRR